MRNSQPSEGDRYTPWGPMRGVQAEIRACSQGRKENYEIRENSQRIKRRKVISIL